MDILPCQPSHDAFEAPERLPVSQQTLHHRLRESGLLASVDPSRRMVQVRRMIEGCPRQVLHLKTEDLAEPLRRPEKTSLES